jgi:hypothetical protein
MQYLGSLCPDEMHRVEMGIRIQLGLTACPEGGMD